MNEFGKAITAALLNELERLQEADDTAEVDKGFTNMIGCLAGATSYVLVYSGDNGVPLYMATLFRALSEAKKDKDRVAEEEAAKKTTDFLSFLRSKR